QVFEIFAEGEYHVPRVEALAAFAIHQRLQIYVSGVGLADRDARAQRARCVEILWDSEVEHPAGGFPRRADAPIAQHRDAPDVIGELRGLQIDAALAEHDRDLALVVQAIAAFGIDQFAVGADDLAPELPETPEPGFADFLVGIALIGSATHLDHHGG